jgi:hypothetical protein
MRFRFRFSALIPIGTGLFFCLVMALTLPGCAKKRPGEITPLPGGRAGSIDGQAKPGTDLNSIASGTEELWILARGEAPSTAADETPGSGTLLAKIEEKEIPMPLKHTDVHASVSGYIGSVEVTQQFLNPYSGKIEAIYVFPLPHNAAVNEFIMTIGERRIRGIIRERKEAEQIYQDAKQQGYVASLLTEERPNVFTQRVANIEPGKEIDVILNTSSHSNMWTAGTSSSSRWWSVQGSIHLARPTASAQWPVVIPELRARRPKCITCGQGNERRTTLLLEST